MHPRALCSEWTKIQPKIDGAKWLILMTQEDFRTLAFPRNFFIAESENLLSRRGNPKVGWLCFFQLPTIKCIFWSIFDTTLHLTLASTTWHKPVQIMTMRHLFQFVQFVKGRKIFRFIRLSKLSNGLLPVDFPFPKRRGKCEEQFMSSTEPLDRITSKITFASIWSVQFTSLV